MEIPPFDMAVDQQQEMHYLVVGVQGTLAHIVKKMKSAPSSLLYQVLFTFANGAA